jgi:hypothetical protein
MKFLVTFFFLLLIIGSMHAQQTRNLDWDDLLPKDMEFEDPFEALTPEQLSNLSIIARVRTLEKEKPEAVTDAILTEADSLTKVLTAEGVQIEELFEIRYEIAALRRARAEATLPELNGVEARIPGYLLPLDYSGNTVTEFLLVPWVGACIHTPPPPKNQIVYVKLEEGYESPSRFEAVWVEGLMSTEARSSELYLVDGTDDITTGYSMEAREVSPYNSK